jgi:hypothetical protein
MMPLPSPPARELRTRAAALPAGAAATNQALLQLVIRLESVLEEERKMLAGSLPNDHDRLIARKEHLALEATRLAQHAGGFLPDGPIRMRLGQAADQLAENARLLRRHIEAVDEIAALIAEICSSVTSDGTYTNKAARQVRQS